MVFSLDKIDRVKEVLSAPQKITIIGHKGPDGDSLGSCCALASVLKDLGHSVSIIAPDAFPDFLNWITLADEVILGDRTFFKAQKALNSASVIFTLDFNHPSRVGEQLQPVLESAEGQKIMIDHHREPSDYCNITFSDVTSCSTAQMIYEFVQAAGWADHITKDVAEAIYCGIMTDTGSFKFPSTTAQTHHIIAHLISMGADNSKVHSLIYDNNSISRIQLLGYTLNKMIVKEAHKLAYFNLDISELEQFGYKKGDTEGFVNYALSMNGIEIAAFFKASEDIVKISFRSIGNWHVNEFARDHFNGGGHKNAAGGASNLSLKDTLQKFETLFPQLVNYNHD